MIIHTFIDKSNTIVSNSNHNMGLNPIAELQYGDIVSRFLFDIDYSNIIDKVNDGTFPNIKDIRHTIKMYNTGWTDYREVNNEYHSYPQVENQYAHDHQAQHRHHLSL